MLKKKQEHPQALLLIHPECPPEICDLADYIGSTKGIFNFVNSSKTSEFIIATDVGILHPLQKAHPDKRFYPASEKMICSNIKLITLEKVLASLKTLTPRVMAPKEIRKKALIALEKMLEISK